VHNLHNLGSHLLRSKTLITLKRVPDKQHS